MFKQPISNVSRFLTNAQVTVRDAQSQNLVNHIILLNYAKVI